MNKYNKKYLSKPENRLKKREFMLEYNKKEENIEKQKIAQAKFHKSVKGQIKSLKARIKLSKNIETTVRLQKDLIEILTKNQLIMKTYVFIYEDKERNELKREEAECLNIKEARILASKKEATSMINDLAKIKVQLK
jgi:hypothetical protein